MKFTDSVIVTLICPNCGAEHEVEVSESAFLKWVEFKNTACIHNFMPTLTLTESEQLISNLCPTCQNNIFGWDTDEEYEEERDEDFQPLLSDFPEYIG